MRAGRGIGGLAGAIGALLILLAATPASAEQPSLGLSRSDPIPSPEAFAFPGSDGYVISVIAGELGRHHRRQVTVTASNATGHASYTAPARFAGGGIHASLGSLGRVDVRWRPDGRVSRMPWRCHGHGVPLFLDEGTYVGTVRFRGEGGFTTATAHHLQGRTGWFRFGCGVTVSEGFPGPGVLLEAGRLTAAGDLSGPSFSAVENRPGRAVSYGAWMAERDGSVRIVREALASAGPRSLETDTGLHSATARPPAPFSGSATFERLRRGQPGAWNGDLTVDFPGHPGVHLAGAKFGATCLHGFREVFSRPSLPEGEEPRRGSTLSGHARQSRPGSLDRS